MKRAAIALSLAILTACGGTDGSPTSPSPPGGPPPPQTSTLTGTVRTASNDPIAGATVRIMDGPNVGHASQTDGSGPYTLAGLQLAGFTFEASASGYLSLARGIRLTGPTHTSNFTLLSVEPWRQTGSGHNVFDMPTTFRESGLWASTTGSAKTSSSASRDA